MKVVVGDTFGKSLKKLMNTKRWWRWEFYEDKYYELKWRIWAIKKFYKVVTREVRPWDYHGSLVFLKVHLKTILDVLQKNEREVDEDRIPKEKDIARCIELINNVIEDNYMERCGYDHSRNGFDFVPYKDKPEFCEMVHSEGSQTDEEISEIIKKSRQLEKDEWEELWDTIKNGKESKSGMLGWWD